MKLAKLYSIALLVGTMAAIGCSDDATNGGGAGGTAGTGGTAGAGGMAGTGGTGERCGDGMLDPGEICDDGNTTDGDGCNATCTSDETCGNGVLDLGEVCDDGNTTDGDGCPATCRSLVPGDTTIVITQDGWSVRCLAWTDNVCVHPQALMDCAVCGIYTSCDVWHDITTFNNNRTDLNFCAIATGDETVVSVGDGGAAVAPRGCGWGSDSHPICEAGKATYVAPQVSDQTKGLNLEETYCSSSTTLITLECAGW